MFCSQAQDLEAAKRSDAAVVDLRSRTLAEGRTQEWAMKITPDSVLKAAKSMKKSTAIGVDGLAFTEMVETCFEARRSLAHVLREITLGLAWPTQTLLNTIVLLGKKAGGTRCVSVCATLYRLLMAIFKADIRSWDAGVASELDSAVAGRMPQIETAKRSLFMEVKTRNGETVIAIMWDVKKYFDSVQIP